MKLVYRLDKDREIYNDAAIRRSHALSTNTLSPLGIDPIYGLYASSEWWANVNSGRIPIRVTEGTIERPVYEADDLDGVPSGVLVRLDDNTNCDRSIKLLDRDNYELLRRGRRIKIIELLEKLKSPSMSIDEDGMLARLFEVYL
ncbi:MAG: hypothetical protein JJ884_13370 [Maricaulis sp.]|uniref:hypothetical protein n=1 Tax=Maricaulis sp. TaxID=1486257 RepID=UPI001B253631|nr:hypothetical protein [Maricaulis sp.]MBO6798279.1 hypothetical protein [Maricaulis sp.]MBO6848500.1 hypothetical protein [Maricaulis sp.]MBO6878084.1 hypothetical protein [Maricaulis sp.]